MTTTHLQGFCLWKNEAPSHGDHYQAVVDTPVCVWASERREEPKHPSFPEPRLSYRLWSGLHRHGLQQHLTSKTVKTYFSRVSMQIA